VLPGVIGISPEPTTVLTCAQYGRVAECRASDIHRKVGALANRGRRESALVWRKAVDSLEVAVLPETIAPRDALPRMDEGF
jgi:hypothetical protein